MGNVVFTGSKVPRNQDHSLQSMARDYRKFMIDWLRLTWQELEAQFGKLPEEL
jgi:hypothetical protein